jgi:hypothetical protein
MSDTTARFDHPRRQTPLALLLRYAGELLFARPDAAARRAGLTVTPGARGLSRTYRDPRLDQLVRCPACAGVDCETYWLPPCQACRGTGRVLPARAPARTGER